MTDVITKSLSPGQSAGTVGRLITTEAAATDGFHNALAPHPAKSSTLSAPIDVRVSDRTVDAIPGATWTFRTPTTDTIVDSFLVCSINATSAGKTAQHVGFNVIDFITVRSAGVVQEIPYRNVARWVIANNSVAERAQLFNAVGGNLTTTAETVIVPLFTFWTPYGQGRIRRNHPGLPAHLLTSGVEVEIRMGPQAQLLDTGATFAAAAFSKVTLVHVIRSQDAAATADARASGAWSIYGYDYQELPQVLAATTAAVSLDLDRFRGNSAGVAIYPVDKGSADANNFFLLNSAINNLSVNIDSASHFRVDSSISSDTRKVLSYLGDHFNAHQGYDAGDPLASHSSAFITFGGALIPGGDGESYKGTGAVYEGSLNLRAVQSLRVDLTNSSALSVYVNVLNVAYARFSIESGLLRRDL